MKRLIGIALASTLSVVALTAPGYRKPQAVVSGAVAARAPVIVELFTSEGCSSCPPADKLLSKLEELQPVEGAEVIALEEHVDYWNHLGWSDQFSSTQFTARQQEYASVFGQNSVYTPEMVVDGGKELVGSHSRDVRTTIAEAARQMKLDVKLEQNSPVDDGGLSCTITTGKFDPQLGVSAVDIWVAVTERGLHSDVKRGENAGEDLHHASVVRSLRKIGTTEHGRDVSFSSDVKLSLERSWNRQNLRVVAFAEERSSKRIVGAASSPVK